MKKLFGGKKKAPINGNPTEEPKEIGTPTNVKHNWHVGFNPSTGEFEGLPPAWDAWLGTSNIRYSIMLCSSVRAATNHKVSFDCRWKHITATAI